MKKLLIDLVEELIVKNGKTTFEDIWNVVENDVVTKEKIMAVKARLYTKINLDQRFINLGENVWDLRSNHPYSKVHIDINKIYDRSETETKGEIDDDMKEFLGEEK